MTLLWNRACPDLQPAGDYTKIGRGFFFHVKASMDVGNEHVPVTVTMHVDPETSVVRAVEVHDRAPETDVEREYVKRGGE